MDKFDDVRNTIYSKQVNFIDTPEDDILKTLIFNESTKWSDLSRPQKFLEYGKIPPLGVKDIHEMGITGKGINVAIIDQPLALDHPEYKENIVEYRTFGPKGYDLGISSMHGPAVASLLVGKNIGVAVDANVYYAAVPSWLGDALYEVEALKWIIEANEKLEERDKIKFVSVSACPGRKETREKNSHMWISTVEEAERKGICVVDCNSFVYPGYVEYESSNFIYGFPNNKSENLPLKGEVYVPSSLRTVAESYDNKKFSYTYCGIGGLSWSIPYLVGLLCLAQQLNEKLTAIQLKDMLIENSNKNKQIVSPKSFLESIRKK